MPRATTPRHPLTDQPFVVPAHADEFPVQAFNAPSSSAGTTPAGDVADTPPGAPARSRKPAKASRKRTG